MHLEIDKKPGDSLDGTELSGMSSFKIKKAVEEYGDLIATKQKLQDRLIKFNGMDIEQGDFILRRLESVERLIGIINEAVYGDEILTDRESCVVNHRLDGETLKEIGKFVCLSGQRVNQILHAAYKKISVAAKKNDVGKGIPTCTK